MSIANVDQPNQPKMGFPKEQENPTNLKQISQ